MWALIKARGLQDPKNKKFMLVEEDMMPIFKTKRIQTFGEFYMMYPIKIRISRITLLVCTYQ